MASGGRDHHNQLSDSFYSRTGDCVRIAVRVTPRASRDSLAGVRAGADGRSFLSVRLTAPPVEGAANQALIACLAKALGLPRSRLRIVSGDSSRFKIVEAQGADDLALARLKG